MKFVHEEESSKSILKSEKRIPKFYIISFSFHSLRLSHAFFDLLNPEINFRLLLLRDTFF